VAYALPIDLTYNVQPIRVCNDAGTTCANTSFDPAVTNKIWSQAGINFNFLPLITYQNTSYLTTDVNAANTTDEFKLLARKTGHQQSTDSNTLNLYFVQGFQPIGYSSGFVIFGIGFINGNGVAVADNRRIDTIAHELGHNLGLDHGTFGVNGNNLNLMRDGSFRTIPASINDVTPDGQQTDQLVAAQVTKAREPLFSINGARSIATNLPSSAACEAGGTINCIDIDFLSTSVTTETLSRVRLTYEAGSSIAFDPVTTFSGSGLVAGDFAVTQTTLAGNIPEILVSITPGKFAPGDSFDFRAHNPFGGTPVDPISIKFEYPGGFSSEAGYDIDYVIVAEAPTLASTLAASLAFVAWRRRYLAATRVSSRTASASRAISSSVLM
jgi:hypothetical protein